MQLIIHQIAVPIAYTDDDIRQAIRRKVRCRQDQLRGFSLQRRSLDARPRNPEPRYVISVVADLRIPRRPQGPDFEELPPVVSRVKHCRRGSRPVVVGAGPAGLMAACVLAEAGERPILLERGEAAEVRASRVRAFWADGTHDPESNVLFGEGGAGLFSDGKLTSRSKNRELQRRFFQVLVDCGAPASILIDAEPHIGSDVLMKLSPVLRRRIEQAGGEIHFQTRLDQIVLQGGRVRAVHAVGPSGNREWSTDACILAVGHSARDVYAMLARLGVQMEPKPFAMGVRLELPQATIDQAQYGRFAGDARLGAASFRLTRRPERDARACYSFCMCPGGSVIACASEAGRLTTNGMSYSRRNMPMGNAAFLVPVEFSDYPAVEHPALAGIAFQRHWETLAYQAGTAAYAVPAVRLEDFLTDDEPRPLPEGISCARSTATRLDAILPAFVTATLRSALPPMLRELKDADAASVVLYAAETRSSSPLRLVRNEDGVSCNTPGLYPAGEGAGYAGGISSSAIDGIRLAETLLAGARH